MNSRFINPADRWQNAVSDATQAHAALAEALTTLGVLHAEYETWYDQMADDLYGTPKAEALEVVMELDLAQAISAAEVQSEILAAASLIEPPREAP